MNRKKLMIVGGLFIIALAVMGIGYGLWFEDLAIGGHVQTGVLDIEFSGPWVHEWFRNYNGDELVRREMIMDAEPVWVDDPEHPDGGYYVPVYDYYGPEELYQKFDTVGCYAFYTPEELGENYGSMPSGADVMRFEVYGMYPSYTCQVNFDMHNPGNVPFHILWAGHPENQEQAIESFMCYFKDMELNMLEEGGRLAEWQVHQGEHIDCEVVFHFTNEIAEERGIGEDNYFDFFYAMRAYQWNEYDAPGVIDWNPFGPSVEPGAPTWTKAAGVRFKGLNTGGEIYLGVNLGAGYPNRVETGYNWVDGAYDVSFAFNQAENKILATIDGPAGPKALEYDFDDLLAPACPVPNWNAMEIYLRNSVTGATLDLNNVHLNGFGLGDFAGGTAGVDDHKNWTITGIDFTQDFTLTGQFNVTNFSGNEAIKMELNVGCIP